MNGSLRRAIVVLTLAWGGTPAYAQPDLSTNSAENPPAVSSWKETPAQRDARMQWWRDARLGMFVHWGLYSAAAGSWDGTNYSQIAEWIQNSAGVPADEYATQLRPLFKPKPGFARAWAHLAKEAGVKYVVFTAKHHDGFALWDSQQSDFNAMNFTGRDLFKEIVTALHDEGLRVGVYFSVLDWHNPDFPANTPVTGLDNPRTKHMSEQELAAWDASHDMRRYDDFMHRQVKEIVSNYGPIDVLWWDWSSKQTEGPSWRASELMDMVRAHQPDIIMNNRLYYSPNLTGDNLNIFNPAKGDFTTPEQHLPSTGLPGVDWESCMTLNDTWGYSAHDFNWKPTATLIHDVADAASMGGNFLINIGPMADGTVPEAIQVRMHELGDWMAKYGDSIYGTTANPLGEVSWGRITAKPGRLYLHVFDWPGDSQIVFPGKTTAQTKAWMLADNTQQNLVIESNADKTIIHLKPGFENPYDSVVVMETGMANEPISQAKVNSASAQ